MFRHRTCPTSWDSRHFKSKCSQTSLLMTESARVCLFLNSSLSLFCLAKVYHVICCIFVSSLTAFYFSVVFFIIFTATWQNKQKNFIVVFMLSNMLMNFNLQPTWKRHVTGEKASERDKARDRQKKKNRERERDHLEESFIPQYWPTIDQAVSTYCSIWLHPSLALKSSQLFLSL